MRISKNATARLVAAMTVVTGLFVAAPAKAEVRLIELEYAIAEVSCYRSDLGAVASVTVTPRDGTDMNFGAAIFSRSGWSRREVSRFFEADELPTLTTTYDSLTGGISLEAAVYEDVNGDVYSFGGVHIACSDFSLN